MCEKDTYDILKIIIRAAFGIESGSLSLSEQQMQCIEKIATRHSILYLVIVGLKKLGCEDLLTDTMKQHIPKATYDYIQRRESLKTIAVLFKQSGIQFVPLKGSVLRDLYPQPCMRTSSDIDVLVHLEDLERAISILEEKGGFSYYKLAHHDAHLVNKRIHLELHFSLETNTEKIDKVLETAWENIGPESEDGSYVFLPEFQIFYNTSHMVKHFLLGGGIGIRPILDLWLLRSKLRYDESLLNDLCRNAGIDGFYKVCCDLLNAWFEGGEYTDTVCIFEQIVLSSGVFGSDYNRVVAHHRKNSGAKYIFTRVFYPVKDIKERYPVCSKHPVLVPVYQVVRWKHLFRSSKRRKVHEELRQMRNLDPEVEKKYDKLLKEMGL